MPKRKEMNAVLSRIEELTNGRFWANGEFLRPVERDTPKAGTPWNELGVDDRREAIYVNTDWKGFSAEQQMEVTNRVANRESSEQWMEGIRVSDQAEHMRTLAAEIRADEHAARVRDYGEPDAATYQQRVAEGAATVQHLEPEPPPVNPAELERAVSEIEQQLTKPAFNLKDILEAKHQVVEQPSPKPERGRER